MRRTFSLFSRIFASSIISAAAAANAYAQSGASAGESSSFWFYGFIFLLIGGIGAGYFFWRRSQNASEQAKYNYNNRSNLYDSNSGSYEVESVDAAMELEWLRQAKKPGSKSAKAGSAARRVPAGASVKTQEIGIDTRAFQEKMRKLQYAGLPINSFSQLAPAKNYQPLPISEDPALLNAIEQANEEFEEDEAFRDLAIRILAAFRSRNSVDALSQIALYDLSANLRSKAVTTLADFDHESVFETILLACADPTREVRAAAARGLFRLNFDRAHAWKRIIEANDEYRMSSAARAAIESGIVVKSLDRLVHEDLKIAYEAFALVSLLICAGETAEIFDALRNHKDERVKYALLHVLKVNRDERTLLPLNQLRAERSWPSDIADRMRETINSFETVAA
jgi:hypothetical protein